MKIYDYSKVNNCVICGSIEEKFDKFIKTVIASVRNTKKYESQIHPKELERQERLSNNENIERPTLLSRYSKMRKVSSNEGCGYDLTNSVLIVSGCNCFGGKDLKYYHDKLKVLNDVLADNNTHVLFVRGNDDPNYFEKELINLSNVKTIQDYSVVKLNKFNCLCVGGCISIDREWRKEQEKRIGKRMYWENENLIYKENEIDKIIKDFDIACVVTVSAPSFAYPGTNSYNSSPWVKNDKILSSNIAEERMLLDKLYNKMIEKEKKPYVWAYSKFYAVNTMSINDIIFSSLGRFHFFHFNSTVSSHFKINFSETLKENKWFSENVNKIWANPSYFNLDERYMQDEAVPNDPNIIEEELEEPTEEGSIDIDNNDGTEVTTRIVPNAINRTINYIRPTMLNEANAEAAAGNYFYFEPNMPW